MLLKNISSILAVKLLFTILSQPFQHTLTTFNFGTIKLKVIIDNDQLKDNYKSEHGFSSLLETSNGQLLFDTGQTEEVFLHNIKELNLTGFENKIQSLVLSHGHYDHTGSVHWILQRNPKLPIYCHQSALNRHYSSNRISKAGQLQVIKGQPIRDISFHKLDSILENFQSYNFKWTDAPTKIMKNVFATGVIPRSCKLETVGAGLFQDNQEKICDPITDDQSLLINTKKGYILLLGCCHSGLINTITHVWNYFPKKRIYGIIGGTHLSQASQERLKQTVKFLKDINCEFVAASHCTGVTGKKFFENELKDKYMQAGVGTMLEFEESEEDLEIKR